MISMLQCFFNKKQSSITLDVESRRQLDHYLKINRPNNNALLKEVELVAVDFETTGLDHNECEIISMGFCPMVKDRIRLADCCHLVVKTEQTLSSENVAIHGLTDDQISQGIHPKQAFFKFLELTAGKIIVAHHHHIERDFIQSLAKTIIGQTIPLSIIDTFFIAKAQMGRRHQPIRQNSLRLFNLRKNFGLPNYNAHNALEDSISTAELFLAQKEATNMADNELRLKDVKLFNYKH